MARFYVSRRSSKCPHPHTVKKKTFTTHAVFIALIHHQMVSSIYIYISKMKKNISNLLTTIPTGNKSKMLRVIYKSKKLSSKFQIKDKTKFKHMHNIVYHGKCHHKSCNSHYGGQTKC